MGKGHVHCTQSHEWYKRGTRSLREGEGVRQPPHRQFSANALSELLPRWHWRAGARFPTMSVRGTMQRPGSGRPPTGEESGAVQPTTSRGSTSTRFLRASLWGCQGRDLQALPESCEVSFRCRGFRGLSGTLGSPPPGPHPGGRAALLLPPPPPRGSRPLSPSQAPPATVLWSLSSRALGAAGYGWHDRSFRTTVLQGTSSQVLGIKTMLRLEQLPSLSVRCENSHTRVRWIHGGKRREGWGLGADVPSMGGWGGAQRQTPLPTAAWEGGVERRTPLPSMGLVGNGGGTCPPSMGG